MHKFRFLSKTYGEVFRIFQMDSFDIKILNIVQQNNRLPTEKIAERVGLSPSAVQRRLKRLRDEKTIEADAAVVSPEAVGKKLLAIVEVKLRKEIPVASGLEGFKRSMLEAPEVIQCFHVTGATDFILVVAAKDMPDYEDFTRRYFIENRNVSGFQTSVVISRVKSGPVIPLEEE
ncbi:MAG: Lrp/AsnC family transcriptional regulator [Pyrinomonadaceae bacterium]